VTELDRRVRFERLFADNAAAVRAYARRRVGDTAADDAVSEVFVVAWRRLDDIPDNERAWLYGCARNVIAHQRRRAARDAALVERLAQSSTVGPANDEALAVAFSELAERDREVLMLTAWEGLEPAEAAVVLGCSRGALRVRLHRARRRLAQALHRTEVDVRTETSRSATRETMP
jgi:RNA polymerase sigma-70 factor (ECF subfamily)